MASAAPMRREPAPERRTEPRECCAGEGATLIFRGAAYPAPVLNISSRGAMVETRILPRLGETVIVRFDGCSPIHAFARWTKDGRVGLHFGCELIVG